MKTNDHYNVLTDPNLTKLAQLLHQLVIDYGVSIEAATEVIETTFKLDAGEIQVVRARSKLGLD